MSASPLNLHATCIAAGGRGLLIRGRSGSGKSALALQLIALGAILVADDRTIVTPCPEGGPPIASAPPAIAGRIEARGLGILALPAASARLAAIVDLDLMETERLPPRRTEALAGADLPLLHKLEGAHFPAALILYLRGERDTP